MGWLPVLSPSQGQSCEYWGTFTLVSTQVLPAAFKHLEHTLGMLSHPQLHSPGCWCWHTPGILSNPLLTLEYWMTLSLQRSLNTKQLCTFTESEGKRRDVAQNQSSCSKKKKKVWKDTESQSETVELDPGLGFSKDGMEYKVPKCYWRMCWELST